MRYSWAEILTGNVIEMLSCYLMHFLPLSPILGCLLLSLVLTRTVVPIAQIALLLAWSECKLKIYLLVQLQCDIFWPTFWLFPNSNYCIKHVSSKKIKHVSTRLGMIIYSNIKITNERFFPLFIELMFASIIDSLDKLILNGNP